jgi:hypothetical protein
VSENGKVVSMFGNEDIVTSVDDAAPRTRLRRRVLALTMILNI